MGVAINVKSLEEVPEIMRDFVTEAGKLSHGMMKIRRGRAKWRFRISLMRKT
jgi:hypothetical protein